MAVKPQKYLTAKLRFLLRIKSSRRKNAAWWPQIRFPYEDTNRCNRDARISKDNGLQVQKVSTLHPIFLSFLR